MLFPTPRLRSSFSKSSRSVGILIVGTVVFLNANYLVYWHHSETRTIFTGSPELSPTPTSPPILYTGIPRTLWYKHGPKGLNDQSRENLDFCLKNNPGYETNFLTDDSGDVYVRNNFAYRPDIVDMYISLTIPILKADLLRYLILFREGGIWNDLDISCGETPIDNWIPEGYKDHANLVVGWEFDVGWGDNFVREFATWTIMAKKESHHLSVVVDDILEGLRNLAMEKNVTIADLTIDLLGDGGVVDISGPRRMTSSIMKSLKATNEAFEEKDTFKLMEPMLVSDVLILPGFSFAASANHYSEDDLIGPALVTHHYAGSWKNHHGGE